MEPLHRLGRFWASLKRPYTILLITVMGAFGLSPLLGNITWGRAALSFALVLVMISAMSAIRSHQKTVMLGLILGGGTLISMLLTFYFRIPVAKPVLAAFEFAFLAVLTVTIFVDVLRAERVTMDTVFGACCVYLMLGLTWTGIYELIEIASPGSFDFGSLQPATGSGDVESVPALSYFSFVTMTTVGYGDVTPIAPVARTFAALQGLVGQFYMAIVIARFVAMELAQRMMNRK